MLKQSTEEIISQLLQLGFSTYEAKAYIALMQNPEITAYEVSKQSGVPQSKIYETMKKIVDKGLAIAEGNKPVIYIALPIDEFLERYKNDMTKSIDYLKDSFKNLKLNPELEYIWHFNNEDQLMSKIKTLINESQIALNIEIWGVEYEYFLESLKMAESRGVAITMVVYGDISEEVGKIHYHEMDGLMENEARSGRWLNIIQDHKECCFGVFNEDNPSGIWTQNQSLMLLSESFISHDIMITEIYKNFKPELDAAFGTNLKDLRKKIGF